PSAPSSSRPRRAPGGGPAWHYDGSSVPSASPPELAEANQGLLNGDFHQFGIFDAAMLRLLWYETERGHAGLRVGFEQEQAFGTLLIIPAEVRAARSMAAQPAVRAQRIFETQLRDLRRDQRWTDMLRHAFGVLGIEIV